ncbi:unnamed protein product [Dibothriocephalus latus]|uniref:Dehydrogenase/reductase SDR family member 1 n=1 Tax=Dibothriocephalus latus TaxID=60516 RepID=A0A3P7LH93_DIBLA|nr:unnamed protein product [Dibothriocephalus latus]
MAGNVLPNLKGCVCLVTGASRGIGRGIALALGGCGATVYLTGRTLKPKGDPKKGDVGGSLEETAADVTSRGGVAIPVAVDHSDDSQVLSLFSRIRSEQKGRLDLLVNNAYSAVSYTASHLGKGYWDLGADETAAATAWDIVNRVGLRNHYICATLATRMMLEYRGELNTDSEKETQVSGKEEESRPSDSQRPGLIINISSLGGLKYAFSVAYGVGRPCELFYFLQLDNCLFLTCISRLVHCFQQLGGQVGLEAFRSLLFSGTAYTRTVFRDPVVSSTSAPRMRSRDCSSRPASGTANHRY